jgi:hypothetical protein
MKMAEHVKITRRDGTPWLCAIGGAGGQPVGLFLFERSRFSAAITIGLESSWQVGIQIVKIDQPIVRRNRPAAYRGGSSCTNRRPIPSRAPRSEEIAVRRL